MSLLFRTEDLAQDEISELFVETASDRVIIDQLKNRNPAILVGSRGVGKSFLLKVAQSELLADFDDDRVFPVYITFMRGSLLQTQDEAVFRAWMLAKIAKAIVKDLKRNGLFATVRNNAGSNDGDLLSNNITEIDSFIKLAENSWRAKGAIAVSVAIPDVDDFRDALEDLCYSLNIKRFVLLIDEAAHIFAPTQQREFFTLFRDLRASYISCNAAVYPGVTSFGSAFQLAHDATVLEIDRDVQSDDYLKNMTDMVEKQADEKLQEAILRNRKNFSVLAYASSGNPRLLLKTVFSAKKMSSSQVTDVIRNFYRTDMWRDHSDLAQKYIGHKELVDWGRNFIEKSVLPAVKAKNDDYLETDRPTSAYFWISRDATARVKSALRILCYTGVIQEHETGIRASRSKIGTRYRLNLGVLFSEEGTFTMDKLLAIANRLTPKRMTEYGSDHSTLVELEQSSLIDSLMESFSLSEQMEKSSQELDLTLWQKSKLVELNLDTVGDVFEASLDKFMEAYYVGNIRARQMRNAGEAAVLEYLSG